MAYHRLVIKNHLEPEELRKAYIKCEDGIEKSHWQIIWLLARKKNPLKAEEVANIVACSVSWVRKIANRYNKEGVKALEDQRKYNGSQLLLNDNQQKQLNLLLKQRPADGGLWTGPKVAFWISQKINRRISAVTGWQYLLRLGFSLKVPRPKNIKAATKKEQKAYKKNS